MSLAAIFPGQGAQYVGMGFDLISARPDIKTVFKLADEIMDSSLSELIAGGPKELLDNTLIAQPAIYVTNYVYWLLFKDRQDRPEYVAGHSLGELSAAQAAGVVSYEMGLLIVKRRAELMAAVAEAYEGGMLAVLGLDDERVTQVAAAAGVQPANFNSPGQVVVAGEEEVLGPAAEAFRVAGAKKVVRLAVGGPFHSEIMKPAAAEFARFLNAFEFNDPRIPLVSNVDARVLFHAEEVKEALVKQIYSPVRWRELITKIVDFGVDRFIEIGPGRVLGGLVKRISPQVNVKHISDEVGV